MLIRRAPTSLIANNKGACGVLEGQRTSVCIRSMLSVRHGDVCCRSVLDFNVV